MQHGGSGCMAGSRTCNSSVVRVRQGQGSQLHEGSLLYGVPRLAWLARLNSLVRTILRRQNCG